MKIQFVIPIILLQGFFEDPYNSGNTVFDIPSEVKVSNFNLGGEGF